MKLVQGAAGRLFAAVVSVYFATAVLAGGNYLFISSAAPSDAAVYYARLLTAAEQARGMQMSMRRLTKSGQVGHPLGIATDSLRRLVYVADRQQAAVLAFRVFEAWSASSGKLSVEDPVVVMPGVEAHGVAVDSVGSLFVSDLQGSRILSVTARDIEARLDGHEGDSAREIYSFAALDPVKAPQGIAVDGFRIFWANSHDGTESGAVIQGLEDPSEEAVPPATGTGSASNATNGTAATAAPTVASSGDQAQGEESTLKLATNTMSAYGVCLTSTRIFYTDGDGKVHSMRTSGGRIAEVSGELHQPRGCAYDGDGTLFIADKEAGRVYSFSGGAPEIDARPLTVALDNIPEAYGLAVFTSGAVLFANSALPSCVLVAGLLIITFCV
jgi:sugar lactone lactonase YvrE